MELALAPPEAAASTTSRRSRLSRSRCSALWPRLVEDLDLCPLAAETKDTEERTLSILAARLLDLPVVLLTLLRTDKSRGDSCVVLEASDSKELPLLEAGRGLR